jgi:hypothetical protein
MRATARRAAVGIASVLLVSTTATAQTRPPATDAECQALRQRLAGHAAASDGVRRLVAARATLPATTSPTPAPSAPPVAVPPVAVPANRAQEIRDRLAKIPGERQILEDQRLAAMVRLDLARARQIQGQIDTLDAERRRLDSELATLPPTPPAIPAPTPPVVATPAPPPVVVAPASDASRVRCVDVAGVYDEAVRIRQRELGAKEGLPGAVPLLVPVAQSGDQLARELADQLGPWPQSAAQVGLLDTNGDGKIDGFVDVPAQGVYRVYRQRADGTLGVDVFTVAGATPVAEVVRRIEETSARQRAKSLADLVATRPAGAVRVIAESPDFARARASWLSGNFADLTKLEGGAVRSTEFLNARGETVRVIETVAPATNGFALRRLEVVPRPPSQEQWEDSVTIVRPVSVFRTDVEVTESREIHAADGTAVGARVTTTPVRFSIER